MAEIVLDKNISRYLFFHISHSVHPLSTNVPDHSVASYRRSDLHPSYYASQRPHPSAPEPEPSNQENHSSAIFHPMTTYTPEAPFTGARRSDLHPSYTAQGLNSASGPTNQASTATVSVFFYYYFIIFYLNIRTRRLICVYIVWHSSSSFLCPHPTYGKWGIVILVRAYESSLVTQPFCWLAQLRK